MGERIRAFDWTRHPLGAPAQWPEPLRMALSLCLDSSFPTAIYWGPQFHVLYNDAWSEIPAEKHPWILGRTAAEGWADIWPIVGPQLRQVAETGQGLALYEQMLPMLRGGTVHETWWNYSFTPIRDADQHVVGVFNQGNEITDVVRARRERQAELDRWREVFHQAPAPIAVLRGPSHVFELANEAYLRLVRHREIVGKPVLEALPEVAQQGFGELLDRVYRSGEPYIGAGAVVKLQHTGDAKADERVLDFIYQPMRTAGGAVDGIFVLAIDVTERGARGVRAAADELAARRGTRPPGRDGGGGAARAHRPAAHDRQPRGAREEPHHGTGEGAGGPDGGGGAAAGGAGGGGTGPDAVGWC